MPGNDDLLFLGNVEIPRKVILDFREGNFFRNDSPTFSSHFWDLLFSIIPKISTVDLEMS